MHSGLRAASQQTSAAGDTFYREIWATELKASTLGREAYESEQTAGTTPLKCLVNDLRDLMLHASLWRPRCPAWPKQSPPALDGVPRTGMGTIFLPQEIIVP